MTKSCPVVQIDILLVVIISMFFFVVFNIESSQYCISETKNQNAKASEKMTTKKVKKIQEKIVDAEYEHRKLSDDNYTIINKIDETVGSDWLSFSV